MKIQIGAESLQNLIVSLKRLTNNEKAINTHLFAYSKERENMRKEDL